MEKQIDNKKEQVQEQQEMEKQEHVKEQQEEVEKQEQVQEPEEKKKQVESEKQQKVQEPGEREQELEKEPEEPPNPPPKKAISPPREVELQHAKPGSPPKLPAPTPKLLPHKNSKPKSPPSDSPPKPSPSDSPPHELEDDYDYKKPPSKDPTTTTTTTTTTTSAAYSFETVSPKPGIVSQEFNNQEGSGGGSTGSGRTYVRNNLSILKRSKRDRMVKRALLASRIFGFVFSLVSFSVMAADRDRGWALDSFYRYKEFRYCMAVNVIAFVYSGFQGYDIAYQLASEKRKLRHHLRYYLDFLVDQILTYLLISASSSAAVRIDDWQSNWGKDEFPQMARASVALSFLAFVALGLSSLISGYIVFTLKSI